MTALAAQPVAARAPRSSQPEDWAAIAPIDLLKDFGPPGERTPDPTDAALPPLTDDQGVRYCRALAVTHYENFSVLTRLVPPPLRDHFAAVYAFCRWADDLGDETGATPEARARSLVLLDWWRAELHAAHASAHAASPATSSITHPVFVALRRTFAAFPHLTAQPFLNLIDAFQQDQRVTRYDTWDQCVDYCTRSANPVGRIVLALGGYAGTPENAERYAMSDATCTALQLINFWQDVRRDLVERDRVYLPAADTGITPDDLRAWLHRADDPAARVRYIRAVRPLIERTAGLFDQGRPLPRTLSNDLAPVVWLFGAGGEAILNAVLRMGCATLWARPSLSRLTKGGLLARAWVWSAFAPARNR